jgi:hypothetical protein
MSESSKTETMERLRSDGRWSEASLWKDAKVKELRESGMKRTDATEEAWRLLEIEYPPLAIEPAGVTGRVVGTTALPIGWGDLSESAPFATEVEWVHQNRVLVVEEKAAGRCVLHWERARQPAPSYGAVNLMEFAATNRKGFMDILQRVKPEGSGDEENVKRERKTLAEIEDLLGRMQQQADESLLADVPNVVQNRVGSLLSDWSRQHSPTLSNAAMASLQANVSALVHGCMEAIGNAQDRKEAEKAKLARIGEMLEKVQERE